MEEKYSRLGIVSFVMSVTLLVLIILLEIMIIINRARVNQGGDYAAMMTNLYGLAGVILFAMFLVGTGLGIAGMTQKVRKKTFAVAGLCVNAALAVMVVISQAL